MLILMQLYHFDITHSRPIIINSWSTLGYLMLREWGSRSSNGNLKHTIPFEIQPTNWVDGSRTLARRGQRAGTPLGNDARNKILNIEFSIVVCGWHWDGRVLGIINKGLAEDRILCERALEREGESGGREKNAGRWTLSESSDVVGVIGWLGPNARPGASRPRAQKGHIFYPFKRMLHTHNCFCLPVDSGPPYLRSRYDHDCQSCTNKSW